MTVTTSAPSGGGEAAVPPEDLVTLTIDGAEISVPKGTLVIRAAEQLGIEIPRFCDHPLLDPAGACRQCIVEVEGQLAAQRRASLLEAQVRQVSDRPRRARSLDVQIHDARLVAWRGDDELE